MEIASVAEETRILRLGYPALAKTRVTLPRSGWQPGRGQKLYDDRLDAENQSCRCRHLTL